MSKMRDKSCDRCGYDLTGLDYEGRCPECGAYFDYWSGEGIANGVVNRHRRGDRVVGVFHVLGLVFMAVVILGIGVLCSWSTKGPGPIILTGVVSVIFLISAVVAGLSLRHR
jgi:hypothetical protein